MATLRELVAIAQACCEQRGHDVPQAAWQAITHAIRAELGGQRVYVSPCDSRKDPARRDELQKAARRLPTGVAAQVVGVSASYAYRVAKRKK